MESNQIKLFNVYYSFWGYFKKDKKVLILKYKGNGKYLVFYFNGIIPRTRICDCILLNKFDNSDNNIY